MNDAKTFEKDILAAAEKRPKAIVIIADDALDATTLQAIICEICERNPHIARAFHDINLHMVTVFCRSLPELAGPVVFSPEISKAQRVALAPVVAEIERRAVIGPATTKH